MSLFIERIATKPINTLVGFLGEFAKKKKIGKRLLDPMVQPSAWNNVAANRQIGMKCRIRDFYSNLPTKFDLVKI
jgi:hypothetical protein